MTKVLNVLVVVIAVLLGMVGLQAAADPAGFMKQYEFFEAGAKGMSEVRCFFGGNFLSWTAILLIGLYKPALRQGAWFAVALAMTVIGLLRLPAMALDGAVPFNIFAMVMELVFAAVLFFAARNASRAA